MTDCPSIIFVRDALSDGFRAFTVVVCNDNVGAKRTEGLRHGCPDPFSGARYAYSLPLEIEGLEDVGVTS
ncbi:hypothetical protein GCM10009000_116260 [Halobacterium noricense]